MSTIENAKKAGIRVCSGGILGLNETLGTTRRNGVLNLNASTLISIPLKHIKSD